VARVTYRIGRAAELLGVSVDTVRRLADTGRLRTLRSSGGQRVIDGSELARYIAGLPEGQRTEVIVGQSARNRFPGIVTRVIKDRVAAQVEIQAGPYRVVSLMTREAADELGLAPGVRAVAAIKATNVVVELPTKAG
jgi:molybdopterin-binding protein